MQQLAVTVHDGTLRIRRADGACIDSACDGKSAAMSASELLAAASASCVAASLVPLLQRHRLETASLHVRVTARGEALSSGLEITVALPPCEQAFLTRCRRAAETCPVNQALNIPLEFHWQLNGNTD